MSSAQAADAPPDVRTVIVPQAQVWCGPSTSDGLYPTNLLRQGDRVQVEHELESGWLAIRPPAGSFSWINNRFVKNIASQYSNYVVTHEDHPVPVMIGSSVKTDRPTKIGVKLPRGAQVRVIDRPITDDEGTWLPIQAPEGEVRYIRKENVANPSRAPAAVVTSTASAKPSATPPPPDGDTLWREAEKAEGKGRTGDAIRLYRLAAEANLSINPARAEEAYRREHWLEQAQRGQAPGGSYYYPDNQGGTSGSPYSLPTYQAGSNVFRTIGSAAPGAANGQLVSTQTPAASATQANGYHYQGRLELTYKDRHEATRRYRLWNGERIVLLVEAGPGIDLSSYEGRTVELWGSISYDHNRRNYLLTATQVREVQ